LVNDQPQALIETLESLGVKHLTCSTYKAKPDNWTRLSQTIPRITEKIKHLYFQKGERIGGSMLLAKEVRFKILKNVRELADANNMKFGVCREGLAQLNTAPCDGSWLVPKAEGA
jgi:hypothetical protein